MYTNYIRLRQGDNIMKVKDINGSLKVKRISSRCNTMKEYRVTLFRGTEEGLLEKLNGNLNNLLSFCDNGFKFDDLVARHFGGTVRIGWLEEKKVFNATQTVYSTGARPSDSAKRCYEVIVYID